MKQTITCKDTEFKIIGTIELKCLGGDLCSTSAFSWGI